MFKNQKTRKRFVIFWTLTANIAPPNGLLSQLKTNCKYMMRLI